MVRTQTPNSTQYNNEFLLGKILWDIRLHFRKFIEVADKGMIHDTWRQNLSPETQEWIREWYPIVKKWNQELQQIEKLMNNQTFTSRQLIQKLADRFNRPDIHYFVVSASLKLRVEDGSDDIGFNISQRLLTLSSLQRDILTHNYSRLWMAEY